MSSEEKNCGHKADEIKRDKPVSGGIKSDETKRRNLVSDGTKSGRIKPDRKKSVAINSNLESELTKTGRLIYTNVGDSMKPFICQGRDLLIIERPKEWDNLPKNSRTGKLKKYDVPLYKRDGGHVYVLHRVLKVRDRDYVICGDNRRHREYGISDRNIVGVLTGVVRNGKEISVSNMRYRCYVHIWCDLFIIRAGIIFVRDVFRKAVRRFR